MSSPVKIRITSPASDGPELARELIQYAIGEVQTTVSQGRAVIEFTTSDPDAVANNARLVLTQDATLTVGGP